MSVDLDSPTDRWMNAVDSMPPLEGPAGTAERILLLLHYGIDWSNSWVSRYRTTYWDQLLPDRVVIATYRSNTLRRWWTDVSNDLGSAPRNSTEREELERLPREAPEPVLLALRSETEALLLRVRIVAEAVRAQRSSDASSVFV